MLTILFKAKATVQLMLFLLLLSANVEAQFIRLTLNLPPGFEAKVDPVPPMILEAPTQEGEVNPLGTRNAGTKWIELRSRDNTQLIVSAKFDQVAGAGLPQLFFLNDGSNEFAKATLLPFRRNVVAMYNKPLTMADLPEETIYIRAWLGVPADRGGLLTIEFH